MVNENSFREAKDIIDSKISIKEYLLSMEILEERDLYRTLIPCPIHDEQKPSLKIFEKTNSFYCFGCDNGGSVVDLHYFIIKREKDRYSLAESVIELSRMYNIKIPNIYKTPKKIKKKEKKLREVGVTKNKILHDIERELKSIRFKKSTEEYIKICNEVDEITIVEDTDYNLVALKYLRSLMDDESREEELHNSGRT